MSALRDQVNISKTCSSTGRLGFPGESPELNAPFEACGDARAEPQVLQMSEHFVYGKAVVEGRELTLPEVAGELVRGLRPACQRGFDQPAAAGVVLSRRLDPHAVRAERRAMRRQDQIH